MKWQVPKNDPFYGIAKESVQCSNCGSVFEPTYTIVKSDKLRFMKLSSSCRNYFWKYCPICGKENNGRIDNETD